jgi:AraC-like DNA-binding protein
MDIDLSNHSFGPLLESNGFVFRETRHHQPFEMPKHAHEGAEFALMLSGHVSVKWRGGSTIASPQTVSYLSPEQPHSAVYLSEVHAFYIGIHPSAWQRTGAELPNLDQVLEYDRGAELQLARQIYDEYRQGDSVTGLMLEGLMIQLLHCMARKFEWTEDMAIPRWLLRAQDVLHAQATQSIRLTTVASEVGVHPGHLMRAFQQHFGETVGSYVRRIRVEIACARIASLDIEETLGSLAADLGFSDQTQFCRVFKRVTGLTPMQYRNSKTC